MKMPIYTQNSNEEEVFSVNQTMLKLDQQLRLRAAVLTGSACMQEQIRHFVSPVN